MSDLISRQAAILTLAEHIMESALIDNPTTASTDIDRYRPIAELSLRDVPSAQPEYTETHSCEERTETHESRREWYMKGYRDAQNAALHESCTDCPLYDHDRHNCPRFNKVIPTAILDAQQPRWIPIKWHDCTDEEREEYGFAEEIVAVFDCDMPNDNQEILVTTSHGYVEKDVCYIDDGYSLDSGYDWIEDITAWMPLPPVYEGG